MTLSDVLRAPSDPPPMSPISHDEDPTTILRQSTWIDLPPGSIVDETYEIETKIGAGGMGTVYGAHHLKLGKRVAIKVINSELSEDASSLVRFAQEARTLAKIQHPAIVAVEHIGELADGRAYFVMEYLRGESLYDRLVRDPSLPFHDALRILDQMARGLEAAHVHGVVHRDLKPENTYLVHLPGEAPTIKLLDFGLAKLAPDTDIASRVRSSGAIVGTPSYMAPEQMRSSNVDHRADVYALGCIAYELLLGVAPFPRARTAPEFFAAHLHEEPPRPRDLWSAIPPKLDLTLFAMLAKDPARRPTLAQVRSVFTICASSDPRTREETQLVVPLPPPLRRRRFATAFVGALIVGVVLGSCLALLRAVIDRHVPSPSTATMPAAPVVPVKSQRAITPALHEGLHEIETPPITKEPPLITKEPPLPRGRVDVPPPAPPRVPPMRDPPPLDKNPPIDKNQTINPFDRDRTINPFPSTPKPRRGRGKVRA